MAKVKINILVEVEYELDPAQYPGCSTPQEMLSVDLSGGRC
jgi:hypothetical protein